MKEMKTSRDYIKDDLDLLEASTSFIKGDGYKEKILEDIEEFAGDGLTDYQKGLVREMAKCDYECGGCVDPYDESFKELLWEDEDLCDNMEEAQDYYQELADMGPAGFYEEFQDEFDWDPDFVAQYGDNFEEEDDYFEEEDLEESHKPNKKSIKEKRITSVKTPTEWFKLFDTIFLEIKDKFPNLGVSKDWDGKFPAKIFIDKLDLELQFDLNYNSGYYSGSMRTYFGKKAWDGQGEPLVAWNSGDYEEFETDVQDAIDYLTNVCESRGSKVSESKRKGKKAIKENASDMDVYIVTPDWDQYPCDEHGNPDGWDPREEAEYFTKLENAALACGMQTGFIPFSDGDAESGMCAPETDGTWQATPAMLRQFIEEYDLPIKVYEQDVDGEVGEEIFDYQSLAFEADPIEPEVRDMGEMYGLPRGASSEEALKFFESKKSKKKIQEMNIGGDGYAVYVKDGKTLLTCKKRGSGKMKNKIIQEPYYVVVFDGEEQKAKEELKKLVSKKESSIFSKIEKEYKIMIVDSLPKPKILDNKNI